MSGAVEFTIQTAPTPAEAPAADTGRPANVPEKFWDAEKKAVNTDALLNSYTELEKKIGTPKADEQQPNAPKADGEKPAEGAEGDEDEKAAKSAVESAGLDMAALQAEFDQNGKLTDEQYEKLNKAGFPKDTVDDFIEYRRSKADGYVQAAYAAAGGEAELVKMTEWAAKGYNAEQVNALNEAVNSGNKTKAEQAIKALKADFVKANGSAPRLVVPTTGATGSGESYTSLAQMLADQAKPEYQTDPAFREKVKQKLARSKI